MKKLIIILLFLSINLFSQEYEIAWEKDIGGTYAQFSKDGEFIYVAGGNTISKYRSADGSFVSTFDYNGLPKATEIYGMSVSKNDKYLITWLGDTPGNHNLYDVATGKAIKQMSGFYWSDFISDDKLICIKDNGNDPKIITIIDVISGKEVNSKISSFREEIIKVSHNGKMFATASISGTKYYLTLWDTETLTEIKRFELEGNTQSTTLIEIKFSWNDKLVGIRRYTPYTSDIYDTKSFIKVISSLDLNNIESFGFDFTVTNNYCFSYLNSNFFIYDSSLKSKKYFNIKAYPVETSSNNLIFTGKALLRPKTVGVSENEQNRLIISPNPASNYITIQNVIPAKAGIYVEIFNILGEKTTPSNLSGLPPLLIEGGENKIDVSNLPAGVYFIKIGDKFEKFIKL